MAEGKGKYGGLMSEIRHEQTKPKPPGVLSAIIPPKPPAPAGKRSDPAYTQKGVFLKRESIRIANERLAARNDKDGLL